MLILKQGESPDHIMTRWTTPKEILKAQNAELLEWIKASDSALRELGKVSKMKSEGLRALNWPLPYSFKAQKRKIILRLK